MVGFHGEIHEGYQVSFQVMTEALQITRIKSAAELAPFLDDWRELASSVPMRSPEWLLGWWSIYGGDNDELCILLFHAPKVGLVGLAPIYLEDVKSRATYRIIGSADACTHHTTWLAAVGYEIRVGTEVARFLLNHKTEWKRLFFEAVDADATAIHATIDFLRANGCLCHQRQIHSCWKISLPDTWDDYLMMLSRSHRKRCRKLQRKFLDSGMIKLRQVKTESDLRQGFEVLMKLHGARWGNVKKPLGVFSDQRLREFHEKVSKNLLACSKLRLAWLESDGKPIAAEYQFYDSKTVYAYQAGIDLSMDAYSPGKLSMMTAIQFAIAQGCEFFDLLRGDEPYKTNWRATPVACYDLRVWQKQAMGRIEWAMWNGYTLAAQWLKILLPPRLINMGLRLFHKLKDMCLPRYK